jgi:hypothetical protein
MILSGVGNEVSVCDSFGNILVHELCVVLVPPVEESLPEFCVRAGSLRARSDQSANAYSERVPNSISQAGAGGVSRDGAE